MSAENVYLSYVATILGLVALFIFALAGRLGRQKKKMETALNDIDNLLDRRLYLLPRMEKAAGRHLPGENEVFTASQALRSHAVGMQSVDERVRFEKALSDVFRRFLSATETSPALKTDEEFARLSMEMRTLEEETEAACRAYNTLTRKNHKLHASFLPSLVGEILSYPRGDLFPPSHEEEEST